MNTVNPATREIEILHDEIRGLRIDISNFRVERDQMLNLLNHEERIRLGYHGTECALRRRGDCDCETQQYKMASASAGILRRMWAGLATALGTDEEHVAYVAKDLKQNADLLREMVGECHMMISRNTAEFQIRKDWESTDLPPRLQALMKRRPSMHAALREFHTAFGLTVRDTPGLPNDRDALLRVNLIEEEAKEFAEATNAKDLVAMADALGDLLYVVWGAAVTLGIDLNPIFAEIHRSNMTKVWEDGTVHRREEDGKIIKPPTYSQADLAPILRAQGAER